MAPPLTGSSMTAIAAWSSCSSVAASRTTPKGLSAASPCLELGPGGRDEQDLFMQPRGAGPVEGQPAEQDDARLGARPDNDRSARQAGGKSLAQEARKQAAHQPMLKMQLEHDRRGVRPADGPPQGGVAWAERSVCSPQAISLSRRRRSGGAIPPATPCKDDSPRARRLFSRRDCRAHVTLRAYQGTRRVERTRLWRKT